MTEPEINELISAGLGIIDKYEAEQKRLVKETKEQLEIHFACLNW